ncbi:Hint domain-containing protein [Siccirubricoccus deserti]|uniref:Hint domain-containing protein n=1 Tax=Siccirubricoccus deserti TaxID=2013562 RepID=A0A9X0R6B8_9PROT|nr:Hint domain-containing protein [Siccirubricoccus deserti]MBC4019187.1 Hint domain-containing protein [Siccirubricoccus deserti]
MASATYTQVYSLTNTGNGTFGIAIGATDLTGTGSATVTETSNSPDNSLTSNEVFSYTGTIIPGTTLTYFGNAHFLTSGGPDIGFVATDGNGNYYLFSNSQNIAPGTTTVSANTTEPEPICFYPGTLIRIPDGELPVEALRSGDLVLTADGKAVPVRWIGRQTVSTLFTDKLRVLPIRVRAGALGENLPTRDLLVSPAHALLVDGVLVQAGALVNGTSVIREQDVPATFTYFHIEVAEHTLVLAEGAPAETFVDNVHRERFDNWNEYVALAGDTAPISEMDLPRAISHRQVPVSIRRRLEGRAAALFGALNAAA